MNKRDDDRLSTADLAREGDYKAERSQEWMVNRGEAEAARSGGPEMAREKVAEDRRTAENLRDRDTVADAPKAASRDVGTEREMQLLEREEMMRFRQRWSDIQAGFVDEPRRAVEQADSLVAETMQRLAQVFSRARQQLEHQWDRGEDVTTEDLRVALQRYRAFFDRLLSV